MIPSNISAANLSLHLALHDAWYSRHVLGLANCVNHIYPSITPPTNSSGSLRRKGKDSVASFSRSATEVGGTKPVLRQSEQLEHQFTMSNIFRKEIENYCRFATYQLNLLLFECSCFGSSKRDARVKVALPFAQRLEIGSSAHQKLLEQEDVAQPSPKFSGVVATIHYTAISLQGETHKNLEPIDSRTYARILICNVSYPWKEEGPPASPNSKGLEMFLYEDISSRRKRSKVEEPKILHVTEVVIKLNRKSWILVDNQPYGPYSMLRINPLGSFSEIAMPLMCFSPYSTSLL